MSTFKFRLETLMRIRTADRDRRRSELAQALQAAAVLEQQRAQIVAEQNATREAARRLAEPGTGDVDGLIRTHRHELILKADLRQLASQQAQVETEIGRRRQALVEADRQVRVLEKLQERQLQEHEREELRQEYRLLDEMGALVAARQRREEVA
jgi:flagellar FliJ protein